MFTIIVAHGAMAWMVSGTLRIPVDAKWLEYWDFASPMVILP